MDKRDLAVLFADRLRSLVEREGAGLTGFSRQTGIDRSALAQFLAPGATRLPRAEALRRISEATGVSVDWLLGLSNTGERARELTASVEIEQSVTPDGESPIERWHREAEGHKIRYVPATLPDQLSLPEVIDHGVEPARALVRLAQGEAVMATLELGSTDLEIAMPAQRLETLAAGIGLWRGLSTELRRAQLRRMAELTEAHYPSLRLHLFDERRSFAAPFTVFGPLRAALYLGPGYLVVTGSEEVRRFARLFDQLVREAVMGADRVHEHLDRLAKESV